MEKYKWSVLYAEDEELTRIKIGSFLENKFEKVFLAKNGKVAYEIFKEKRPDIVITDILMPIMSGTELISKIREIDNEVEVIIITADMHSENIIDFINNYNINRYITKPVDFSLLERIIEKSMKKRQDMKELERYRENLEKLIQERTLSLIKANEMLEIEKENAERANKAKSLFLSNMSHEIRTPINGIFLMTDILLETGLTKDQLDVTKLLKTSAKNLLNIINEILDFSKIEAGKIDVEIEQFNLNELVLETVEFFNVASKNKNVEVEWIIEKNIHNLYMGDKNKIRQVLINLIDNGIKFTENGDVILSIEKDDDTPTHSSLVFSVIDQGIGISQENLQMLFRDFIQIENLYTKKFQGTGLGLSISKSLVELMNGKIWVESKEGAGSRFSFKIKLEKVFVDRSEKNSKVDNIELEKKGKTNNPSILIVDDNKINIDILRILLEKKGYRISLAFNGQEACEQVYKEKYDLILMDIQMPILNGIAATKIIREFEKQHGIKTPIFAVTAYINKDDIDVFKDAGMDDYISKPIDINALIAKMNNYIKK